MLKNICQTSSRLVSLNSRSFSAASLIRIPRLYNLTRPTQLCRLQTSIIRRKMSAEEPKHTNRLAQEKSPYLLQHAHNPVDWYPWGEEAIQKAKDEDKVIFLSVGYSTCHWCHVMERESFENEDVAKTMNENFVNIKVDREERPDIDRIYMQFVLLMNGSGGWPMSVWLTPDLTPITAGTYFPTKSRWGMPGFDLILKTIAEKWKTDKTELIETGQRVIDSIQNSLKLAPSEELREVGCAEGKMHEAVGIFEQRFDDTYGGFGVQPKFPEVSRLNLLFHSYIVSRDEDAFNMATLTLKKIGNGGIHDHVFGGFSRYAVDRKWHIPHFEKMLYDQAQLMTCYSNAYKITTDRLYLDIADGIYRYIVKDLRHPSGGFYSGEDADSLPTPTDTVKIEGAFYAWKFSDIQDAINDTASKYTMTPEEVFKIYCHHYSLKEEGNVDPTNDPHKHFTGMNVLIVRKSLAETALTFDMDVDAVREILRTTNDTLHEIREQRPRPHLDTKIITSWNGLMLSGLAKLANCHSEDREKYLKTAEELYKFARTSLFNQEKKMLVRSCYGDGDVLTELLSEPIDGFLDDYAFLIRGLLDYYKASLDVDALLWAKELQDIQDSLFWDESNGGYFFSQADSPYVVMRLKGDTDGSEPCGNSVSARNLILLSHYFDDENYEEKAVQLFAYFSGLTPFGFVLPEMLSSLLLYEYGLDLVAVVGPDTEKTKKFVQICQQFYIPGMIIVHVDPEKPNVCSEKTQGKYKMVNDQPTVYICHNKVCRLPVNDPEKLEDNLRENYTADDNVVI